MRDALITEALAKVRVLETKGQPRETAAARVFACLMLTPAEKAEAKARLEKGCGK